ncbi:MAG: AmmeMemoRadiSam system protein B, partial [Bacteroidota bacterium]
MKKLILPLLFPVMLMSTSCSGQENDNKDTIPDIKTSVFMKNRKPVVAGQFYAGTESQLRSDLKGYFADAVPKKSSNVTAIISPHAGYVYSGEVAASSFNQVDNGRKYEHIFVIASSHRVLFGGASIYYLGNYETPLGEVKVDTDFAGKLI